MVPTDLTTKLYELIPLIDNYVSNLKSEFKDVKSIKNNKDFDKMTMTDQRKYTFLDIITNLESKIILKKNQKGGI